MGNYNWKEKSDITLGRNLGPMAFPRLFSPRSPAHLPPPHSGLSLALLSARLDPKIRTGPCKRNTLVIQNSPRPGSFHQIASRKDHDRTSCGFGSQAADCIRRIHLTGARARARECQKRVCQCRCWKRHKRRGETARIGWWVATAQLGVEQKVDEQTIRAPPQGEEAQVTSFGSVWVCENVVAYAAKVLQERCSTSMARKL